MSLVLVSHSKTLAEGLRDMVVQVAGEGVRVTAAGGTADGRLGTTPRPSAMQFGPFWPRAVTTCSSCLISAAHG